MRIRARYRLPRRLCSVLVAPAVLALLLSACTGGGTNASPNRHGAQPVFDAGYQSATYSNPAHWLCRPDLPPAHNACAGSLDVTSVAADGNLTVQHVQPAHDAPLDCFYVYPTVDPGPGPNESIDGPHPNETTVARTQAAPFGRLCNVYAPLYRQVTLPALFGSAAASGSDRVSAYGDVLDAFRYYLGNLNHGRPFVLIGHSQGSIILTQLISQEIDRNPALRQRMISAMLPGGSIQVPVGGDVGGTFANIPACRAASQVNCVIGYSSFRATSPPPPNSLFGRPAAQGTQDLCVNPANLAGGAGALQPIFDIGPNQGLFALRSSIVWAPGTTNPPRITTPYVSLPSLVTGQCVDNGQFSYLSLAIRPSSGLRADNIPGDLTPQWGLHLVDINVAQGNLIEVVQRQAQAWQKAH